MPREAAAGQKAPAEVKQSTKAEQIRRRARAGAMKELRKCVMEEPEGADEKMTDLQTLQKARQIIKRQSRELADYEEGSHLKSDGRGNRKAKAAAVNSPTPRVREPGRRTTCTATSGSGNGKSTGYELIDLTKEVDCAREEARASRPPAGLLSSNHHAASMLTFNDVMNEGGMDLDTDEYKLFGANWMDAAIDDELRDPLERRGQPEPDSLK
jgi:hypothetical protein